jgi:hypothetical protein
MVTDTLGFVFKLDDEKAVVGLWRRCDLVRPWNDPYRDDVTSLFRASGDVSLGPGERTQHERQTVYDRREDPHPVGGG